MAQKNIIAAQFVSALGFLGDLIIWELPARNTFHLRTATTTKGIKGGIYPFLTTGAAVAKNIVAVCFLNFLPPIAKFGDILFREAF